MIQTSREKTQGIDWKRLIPSLLVMLIVLSSFALFIIESGRVSAKPSELRVWFFDIGQGDAIWIETPTGEQFLIDGGRDASILAKLGSVMWPWDRTIDGILATHPDADHIAGLVSVLERYEVGAVYETGLEKGTKVMEALLQGIQEEDAEHHLVQAGDRIRLGEISLLVLAPERTYDGEYAKDANKASLILLLEYGETTVLLTGDAGIEEEEAIARHARDVDVLKVGHHGSLTSSSESFLDVINPEYAVIQVGRNNGYGHPHPIVVKRLSDRGVTILRNDQDGDILLRSVGGEPVLIPKPLPF